MRNGNGIVKPGEEKAEGHLIKVLKGRGSKEGEARFFSVISCERIRGNGNKLKNSIFRLNIGKKGFIVRVFRGWKRCLQRLQSPSLEIFKT